MNNNNKGQISWDYLIWIGLVMLLVWAFLKSLGIINSPVWVEMIPYFGIGVAGMGGAYKLGKIMEGVERLLRIEERFISVENTHKMCIEGKLDKSPYKKE